MPPLKEIRVKSVHQDNRVHEFDPSESSFLLQHHKSQENNEAMSENAQAAHHRLVYSESAKDVISRARKGLPRPSVYDVRYLTDLISSQS